MFYRVCVCVRAVYVIMCTVCMWLCVYCVCGVCGCVCGMYMIVVCVCACICICGRQSLLLASPRPEFWRQSPTESGAH